MSILFLIVFTSGIVYGARPANKMYRVMNQETKFLSAPTPSDGGKELLILHRGDTLIASEEIESYMEEYEGKRLHSLPLIYNGRKGYVYYNSLEPIKATPEDTIYAMRYDTPSSETELKRSLYPLQDWAMNNSPVEPYSLVWVIIGCLAGAAVFSIVPGLLNLKRPVQNICHALAAAIFVVATCAELHHTLSLTNITWFFSPSIVGWGKAILNFILFCIVCGVQGVLFVGLCYQLTDDNGASKKKKDEDDDDIVLVGVTDDKDDEKDWSGIMIFAPFVLLLVVFVMFIIDAFSGGEWGIKTYGYIAAVLIVPMAVLEFSVIKTGNALGALIFPFFYLIGGAGIMLVGSVLGLWILVAAVIIIVLGIAIAAIFGAIGGLLTGGEIKGELPDGTVVKGYKGLDGKFHANNGKTYNFD